MNDKESIQSVTKELKKLLLNTKKQMETKDESLKKVKHVHELTKKEYQTLYNENMKIKKQLQQDEEYFKSQQIQKKRKERDKLEKEKKELERKKKEDISVLDEINKLKKMDILKYLAKKKKTEPEDLSESEEEEKEEKAKPIKKET